MATAKTTPATIADPGNRRGSFQVCYIILLKDPVFNWNNRNVTCRTGNRVPCKGKKKKSIEIVPERPKHIFKELKGTLSK